MSKQEAPSEKKKQSEQYNPFIKYSSLAIQMAVIIFASNYLGEILDEKYGDENESFSTYITLIGVFLSIVMVIHQVIRDSKKK